MDDTRTADAELIINALTLARERVTAGTIAAKQERRDEIKAAISDIQLSQETDDTPPSAEHLRGLLGDPDDKGLRAVLDRWDR